MFLINDRDPSPGLLRYEVLSGEPVDEFSLSMLTQNPPKGVLRLGRERTEEFDHLLLPVSKLVRLTSDAPIVNAEVTIDKCLLRVREVREELSRYMIPPEELVLRPEWTFLDPEAGEPVFLVLPTPLAKDLSLSMEDYETLLRQALERKGQIAEERKAGEESAKRSAKRAEPAKPFRERVREFWENLD